jgi:hypothetical protein
MSTGHFAKAAEGEGGESLIISLQKVSVRRVLVEHIWIFHLLLPTHHSSRSRYAVRFRNISMMIEFDLQKLRLDRTTGSEPPLRLPNQ